MKVFTADDEARLRSDYERYVSTRRLEDLANEMGRTKAFICRKAKSLGLTNPRRCGKSSPEVLSAAAKTRNQHHGHPRGMAGKKHSDATKEAVRKSSLAFWSGMSDDQRSDHVLKQMKGKIAAGGSLSGERPHGKWKAGWREIGQSRKFYRSRWEANYARYLQWLKVKGDIQEWRHEPETFWFDAIKRGVRSYLPDFRVWELDGSSRLHEVKGWMDDRSRTTLKRMAKYHPQEIIVLIKEREYRQIENTFGRMIEGWES